MLIFEMAALARALAVSEEGLNAVPARADVRALLPVMGVVEGMMGVEAVAPQRLLKLYMLLENEAAAGVFSENPPRFIMAISCWYCARAISKEECE